MTEHDLCDYTEPVFSSSSRYLLTASLTNSARDLKPRSFLPCISRSIVCASSFGILRVTYSSLMRQGSVRLCAEELYSLGADLVKDALRRFVEEFEKEEKA